MRINEIIKERRLAKGFTQEQIANYLGVTAPAVNKWEKGTSCPDIVLLPALARLLDTDLNTLLSFQDDLSEKEEVENDLTGPFMPHGIGHPLGLQVHDVAGFMQDDSGTHLAAPAKYPYLRCTRILQPGMVLTIEPGIYFIESLLAPWREGQFSKHFNWQKIEALKPFGGIRIEDNVVIHENNVENMTRDLKLA